MAARSWIQTMPPRVEAFDERREPTISVSVRRRCGRARRDVNAAVRLSLSSCCHTCMIICIVTRVQSVFIGWIWIHRELCFSGWVVQLHRSWNSHFVYVELIEFVLHHMTDVVALKWGLCGFVCYFVCILKTCESDCALQSATHTLAPQSGRASSKQNFNVIKMIKNGCYSGAYMLLC